MMVSPATCHDPEGTWDPRTTERRGGVLNILMVYCVCEWRVIRAKETFRASWLVDRIGLSESRMNLAACRAETRSPILSMMPCFSHC